MFSSRGWKSLPFLALAVLSYLNPGARAATFTVNSAADRNDSSAGDGVCNTGNSAPSGPAGAPECTLRAAIQEANALSGQQSIILPSGTYTLTQPAPCKYRTVDDPNLVTSAFSTLCISGQITITGAGASTTTISGKTNANPGPDDRVLLVSLGAHATISGVTITGGDLQIQSQIPYGAGINNQGQLLIDSCVITGNIGFASGVGIFNAGTLQLRNSTVSANSANVQAPFGAGLANSGGTVSISSSAISNNSTNGGGAGIWNESGTISIGSSTISGNTAGAGGGGLFLFGGNVSLSNTTISGNSAFAGGGIGVNGGSLILNNVTVTQNAVTQGAGGIQLFAAGSIQMGNSIVARNTSSQNQSPDCIANAPVVSEGHNLIMNTNNCRLTGDLTGNITGQDPLLGTLSDNGGATQTHALLANSPAVNAASPLAPGSGGKACAAADQRGFLRPIGSTCDIGAFERVASFSVTKITPGHGGTGGEVVAVVSGNGFGPGSTVLLRRAGRPDISGSSPTPDLGGSSMTTVFNLGAATAGAWDVVVRNPDGTTATAGGAFTVETPKTPEVWSQVVAHSVRPGQNSRFSIEFGNRGNVDAFMVPLTLSIPANVPFFSFFPINAPPPQAGQVQIDWTTVPVFSTPLATSGGSFNIELILPVVPAGFTGVLQLSLTVPPTFSDGDTIQFFASMDQPFAGVDGVGPGILNSLVAGAVDYAQTNLGAAIPPSLFPALTQYATTQFQNAIAAGQRNWVSSSATQPLVYSLPQLQIDIAEYAAVQSKAPATQVIFPSHALRPRDAGGAGAPPCSNKGVLEEGQFGCKDNQNPLPPDPDKSPANPALTPGQCRDQPNHQVSSDGSTCIPIDQRKCPKGLPQTGFSDPFCVRIPIKLSVDPNDKVGPQGAGSSHYEVVGNGSGYTISFENLPAATAPAQQVVVTDQVDTSKFDLTTVSLGSISVGGFTVTPPPGSTAFTSGIDLRPNQNVILKIDAALNPITGLLTWNFTSLDTGTEEITTDPSAGFLPPDTNPPAGEGSVSFTLQQKPGLASGTSVCNQATVVFDTNAPIHTPTWCNIVDLIAPVSHVSALPPQETTTSFSVQWSATDSGSGVADYSIYVSDNGGAFTPWLTNTSATSSVYPGVLGHTYGFYSIARDFSGNVEAAKTTAEASTRITPPTLPSIVATRTLSRDSKNNVVAMLTLTNMGGSTARSTLVTIAKIGATAALTIPAVPVDIAPSTSAIVQVVFPGNVGSPGANAVLTIGGTYAGGSFNFTSRINLP